MSLQDPISDMLTRIRNGQQARHESVSMPASKLKTSILDVMKDEGYITDYSVEEGAKPTLTVALKYYEGKGVIAKLSRASRPGLRHYAGKNELPEVLEGLGVSIISTSKGVMSNRAAQAQGLGGEVLCFVE